MTFINHGVWQEIVSTALCLMFCNVVYGLIHQEDICKMHNGHRLYIELDENGILTAENLTALSKLDLASTDSVDTTYKRCSLELTTCPNCAISLKFHYLNLSVNCRLDASSRFCPCDALLISEPPYTNVSRTPFCGTSVYFASNLPVYKSQTHTVSVVLLYTESYKRAFILEYLSERNRQVYTGSPDMGVTNLLVSFNANSHGIIKSPFFPLSYPSDVGVEYIISCKKNISKNCHVCIIFKDFLIDTDSTMEFFDSNGQRLEVTSGAFFRPPAIITTGPSLLIRFYANGGTAPGFKAVYSFVNGNSSEKSLMSSTDCGGFVENLGAAITMMNMVKSGMKRYDCIWLIRPSKKFFHFKTHLYLKVVSFIDMADDTELKIQKGLTSEEAVLEILHPLTQPQEHKEHIIPISEGFYISLKGTFRPSSRLSIVYTAFSYMDCFADSDFLCKNHHCIPSYLQCDSFDHCGDNSDESKICSKEQHEQHWYSLTPNYYFPKIVHYPDLKTVAVVFLVCSTGLILLIAALIILLQRMGSRNRQQRELQEQLRSISDFLDGSFHGDDEPPDDPPVYEEPPNYNEIINVFVEDPIERTCCRLKQQLLHQQRVKCQQATGASVNNGNTFNPEQFRPSRDTSHFSILIPSSSSTSDLQRCLSKQLQNINHSCQTTAIPNSPPPPYSSNCFFVGRSFVAVEDEICNQNDANISWSPSSPDFVVKNFARFDSNDELPQNTDVRVGNQLVPVSSMSDSNNLLLEVAETLILKSSSNNFNQNLNNLSPLLDSGALLPTSLASSNENCFIRKVNKLDEEMLSDPNDTVEYTRIPHGFQSDLKLINMDDDCALSNPNEDGLSINAECLVFDKHAFFTKEKDYFNPKYQHVALMDDCGFTRKFLMLPFRECNCEGACGCKVLRSEYMLKKCIEKKRNHDHASSDTLVPFTRSYSDSGLEGINFYSGISKKNSESILILKYPSSSSSDINSSTQLFE